MIVGRKPSHHHISTTAAWLVTALVTALLLMLWNPTPAVAAAAPVVLGTVGSYSVLGGTTVTNTGPSTLSGDLGLSPGTAVTGFPPGLVGGSTHVADAPASQAQSDLITAYNDTAGRAPDATVAGDLGGRTILPGVYSSSSTLALTGGVTLDGQGNPDSVFIFQVASTLITGSASVINVVNGAQACNIYWQVGSSATLGTASSFQGTIMALASITVTTGSSVKGRALARNGQVTLDSDTFTSPVCAAVPTATPTVTASGTPTTSVPPSTTVIATVAPSATPTKPVSTTRKRTASALPSRPKVGAGPSTNAGAGAGARAGTGAATGTQRASAVPSNSTVLLRRPTGSPQLAQTGAKPPLTLGIVLVAVGAILVLISRRRGGHRA